MKKIVVLILALVFALVLVSCGESANPNQNPPLNDGTGSTVNSSSNGGSVDDDEEQNVSNVPPTPDTPIGPGTDSSDNGNGSDDNSGSGAGELDTTKQTVTGILGSALNVFTQTDTFGGEGQISSFTRYTAEINVSTLSAGQRANISQGGIYKITGSAANSQIFIKAKDQDVTLLLAGVDMTSTSSTPTIYAEDCRSVTIVLAEGTVNKLSDTSVNGENGVIKVKSCNLTLDGKGTLEIVANAKHGISNTKELVINGGTYKISSTRHGIYGKLGVTINGGKFTINSARSGIKTGDNETGKEAEGKIVINSGSISIRCNTDGLNSIGTVEINNGRVQIAAMSRGIDATKDITIRGGIVILNTDGDAIRTPKTEYDVNDVDGDGNKREVLIAGANITVEGSASISINAYGNGMEGENVKISTSGAVYIRTVAKFVESTTGEYKLQNGSYVVIGTEENYSGKRYALSTECKGIEAASEIRVTNTKIGIDSFEDCLNGTTVFIRNCTFALNTTKDAIEASSEKVNATVTIEGPTCELIIIDSDKGIKAQSSVILSDGTTRINAKTDAIKSENVSVLSGKHILFDKVEYEKSFIIKAGFVVCISTTENPVSAKCEMPNASGVIENKDLCVFGRIVTFQMGDIVETVVLPKDYTEKACVFFGAEDESMSDGLVIIGSTTETLVKGKLG